ncbi:ABC transporter permease [Candidatus Nephthysia bennettiae]|uniref:ABC transporter permease n=1 Tax=Candidatus Nephthysia bennettiae TaxID=3127016 RepID=A0A934N937_9BACT|nr:ABC transporter permease [Candidatus Dormibacteraeota bacterium]
MSEVTAVARCAGRPRVTGRPSYVGALRGELLKIRRQRSTLAGLGVATVLFVVMMFAVASTPGEGQSLEANPLKFWRQTLDIFQFLFETGAGIFMLVLSARLIAMEYDSGTIRVLVARGAGRLRLLLAKLAALALVAAVMLAGFLILCTGAMYLLINSFGDMKLIYGLPAVAWSELQTTVLAMVVSMMMCVLLGSGAAVIGRSMAFAIGAAMAVFPADNFGTIILGLISRATQQHFFADLSAYLLGPNLNILAGSLQHRKTNAPFATPLVTVTPEHVVAVIVVYGLALLAVSLWLTYRRDVLS